jgi:hypothetical protein
MQPVLASVPTLAVAVIFCLYNVCRRARLAQRQRQRQRGRLCANVAYMLWVSAGVGREALPGTPPPRHRGPGRGSRPMQPVC